MVNLSRGRCLDLLPLPPPPLSISGLPRELTRTLNVESRSLDNIKTNNEPLHKGLQYDEARPFPAEITSIEVLSGPNASQKIFKVDLSFPIHLTELSKWIPGDSIGITPKNQDADLDTITSHLIIPSPEIIHKGVPCLVRSLLQNIDFDASLTKKALIRLLSTFARNPIEMNQLLFVCSRSGLKNYSHLVTQQWSFLDLLETFPSLSIPIQVILEHFERLKPRWYSIVAPPTTTNYFSEDGLMHESATNKNCSISIVVGYCRYTLPPLQPNQPETIRIGLVSGQIHHMITSNLTLNVLPIFPRPKTMKPLLHLRPLDQRKEIVCLAGGTGLAGLMSFIYQQAFLIAQNPAKSTPHLHVFYASREGEEIFLGELNNVITPSSSPVISITIAISRSSDKYVHALTSRYPNLDVVHGYITPKLSTWLESRSTSRPLESLLSKVSLSQPCTNDPIPNNPVPPILSDCVFLVCGSMRFITGVRTTFSNYLHEYVIDALCDGQADDSQVPAKTKTLLRELERSGVIKIECWG